jgi:hypothetical protein
MSIFVIFYKDVIPAMINVTDFFFLMRASGQGTYKDDLGVFLDTVSFIEISGIWCSLFSPSLSQAVSLSIPMMGSSPAPEFPDFLNSCLSHPYSVSGETGSFHWDSQ